MCFFVFFFILFRFSQVFFNAFKRLFSFSNLMRNRSKSKEKILKILVTNQNKFSFKKKTPEFLFEINFFLVPFKFHLTKVLKLCCLSTFVIDCFLLFWHSKVTVGTDTNWHSNNENTCQKIMKIFNFSSKKKNDLIFVLNFQCERGRGDQ